jgi:hypothetical protein
MKRFYFGGEDDEEGEDEDDLDETKFMMPDAAELIAMTHLGDSDQHILNCAIKICEKSLFWRFRSLSYKLNAFEEAFNRIRKLTEGQEDAEI